MGRNVGLESLTKKTHNKRNLRNLTLKTWFSTKGEKNPRIGSLLFTSSKPK